MPPFQEIQPETINIPQRRFAFVEDFEEEKTRTAENNDKFEKNVERRLRNLKTLILRVEDKLLSEDDVKRIAKQYTPKDGHTPTERELRNLIRPLIPKAKKGEKGKDGEVVKEDVDKDKLVDEITPQILRRINDDFRRMMNEARSEGASGVGSLAAWGGSRIMSVQNSGDIDDTTVGYRFDAEPSVVFINGAAYAKGDTTGAYTWTYDAGLVTLNNPIGTGSNIFAIQ